MRVTIGVNANPDGERAEGRIRTDDLLITNQLLYQLSYFSIAFSCIGTQISNFKINKKRDPLPRTLSAG